jgi:hypothetical protein
MNDSPKRFSLPVFLWLLGGLVVLTFPLVLIGTETFYHRDYGMFAYPVAWWQKVCFWRGEMPLWNPLNDCGVPHLAQWNTMVLYPGTLLYLLLPFTYGLSLFCILHLFFGGLGMFYLVRRWTGESNAAMLAGVGFSFNGFMLICLGWPSAIAALSWIPWTISWVERGWREGGKSWGLGILAGTMQMLTGTPEVILLTWFLAGGWWGICLLKEPQLRRLAILRWFGMVTCIALICAPQLLPFLQLLGQSQRDAGYGDGTWAIPAWGGINLIFPHFGAEPSELGGYTIPGQYFTRTYYVGLAMVLLATMPPVRALRWRWMFLWVATLITLLLAQGDNGFLMPWLKRICPSISVARYPVKFMYLAVFVLPLLAGLSLARLFSATETERTQVRKELLRRCGLMVVGGILLHWAAYWWVSQPWEPMLKNSLVRFLFTGIFMAGLLVWLRVERAQWMRWIPCGLAIILWVDLLQHQDLMIRTAAPVIYERGLVDTFLPDPRPRPGETRAMISPEAHHALAQTGIEDPQKHIPSRRATLSGDFNMLEDIPKVDGFYAMYPAHHMFLLAGILNLSKPVPEGLQDFLGVSHISRPGHVFDWQSRQRPVALVSAGQMPVTMPDQQALSFLLSTNFDPKRTVILSPVVGLPSGQTPVPEACIRMLSYSTREWHVEVETPRPTMAVFSQTWYPNWTAALDQQPVALLRANLAFQAVAVPAGKHQITLRYEDRGFRRGCWLSGITIILLGGLVYKQRKTNTFR